MGLAKNNDWPAIGTVSVPWQPQSAFGDFVASRRQALKHRGPYKAAVVPKIADLVPNVPGATLALADEAVVDLAKFDADLAQMVAPFASILLRSEAASSSQIENLSSTPASIIRAELGLKETTNSALIVSNQNAMTAAVAASNKLSANAILKMHRVLLGGVDPENAGKFRNQPVWIGGSAIGPHDADYVAPNFDEVPDLIDDLIEFCQRTDMPALVQVAIAHAQFETIHPFTDGNGRTGRALVHVLLHRLGVTKSILAPVSAGLLRDTKKYFAALGEYRAGNISPIISVFAEASMLAVRNARKLAVELEEVRLRWQDQLQTRSDSSVYKLLDALLAQPVINNARATEVLGVTSTNAQLAIDKLVEVGILVQQGSAQRNRVWLANDVLFALDRFASRIRR